MTALIYSLKLVFVEYFSIYLLYLKVKLWLTLNEPWVVAYHGYGRTHRAPGLGKTGTADYLAAHNLIKAHAKVYRLYDRKWRSLQQGQSIILK